MVVLLSIPVLVIFVLRALYPGHYLDEGAYAGTVNAILHGDIFLSHFWFDKLPLQVYLQSFGVLAFGKNAFGYHFSGLLFSFLNYFLLLSILKKLSGEKGVGFFPLALLATGFLVSPLFLVHGPSAFSDPFQIFFLLLFFQEAAKPIQADAEKTDEKKLYTYWMLGLFAKQTAVVWFPIIIGYWYLSGALSSISQLRGVVKRFFRSTVWFWGVVFLLGITFKKKFAFISAFQYNSGGEKSSVSAFDFLYRIKVWTSVADKQFFPLSLTLTFLLFTTAVCVLLFLRYKRDGQKHHKAVWILLFPFLVNVAILLFSPCRMFARYLMLPVLQALFVTAYVLRDFETKKAHRVFLAVLLLLDVAVIRQVSFDFKPYELATREFSQAGHRILEEKPRGGLVHTDNLWHLFPYTDFDRTYLACPEEECVQKEKAGRKNIEQYLLLFEKDLKGLPKGELLQKESKSPFSQCKVNWASVTTGEKWREKLRLKKVSGESKVSLATVDAKPIAFADGWYSWRGIPGQMLFTLENSKWLNSIEFFGHFDIARHYEAQGSIEPPRDVIGFRVSGLRLNGFPYDFSDLVPIVWRGYFIPLEGIECL